MNVFDLVGTFVVKGVDNAEKTIKSATSNAQSDFSKMGKKAGDASNDVERGMQSSKGSVEKLTDAAKGAATRFNASMDKVGNAMKTVAKGGAALVGAMTAVGGGVMALATGTQETVEDMGKLSAAFDVAGWSADEARGVYDGFVGILGETDQAVEASNHLAKLCDNQEELAEWTDIAAGIYATFGDSLPLEGLTEAANETAKCGQVTGPFADALNWTSINAEALNSILGEGTAASAAFAEAINNGATQEDAFNAALATCTTEQERATLVTEMMAGMYTEAGIAYQEVNGQLIEARKTQSDFNVSMAEAGKAVQPIATAFTEIGTAVVEAAMPYLIELADWFMANLPSIKESVVGFVGDARDKFVEIKEAAQPFFDAAMSGFGWLVDNLPTILPILAGLVAGFYTFQAVSTIIAVLTTAMTAWKTATEGVTAAQWLLNAAQNASPVAIVITLIAALVAAFATLWNTNEEFRNFWIGLWDSICGAAGEAWGWLDQNVLQPLLSGFQGFCDFFAGVPEFWGGVWNDVCGAADTARGFLEEKWQGLQDSAGTFFGGIKDSIQNSLNDAATIGGNATTLLKDFATGNWSALSADAARLFGSIDGSITSHLQSAKNSGIPIVSELASGALEKWNWLKTDGAAAFASLASSIGSNLENAKTWANDKARGIVDFWRSIPDSIIGFFSGIGSRISNAFGSIHFPSPHVSWQNLDIAGLSVPIPNVEWYAKAMRGGMIMNEPTVFGINPRTGQLMAGGEAGSETVVGTESLMSMIKSAVASVSDGPRYAANVRRDMYEAIYAATMDAFAAQGDIVVKLGEKELLRACRRIGL